MAKQSEKLLVVEMPDGSEWAVPAEVVAHSYASYYAENGRGQYQRHYRYAMSTPDELTEWASCDMNWSEVEKYARQTKAPDPVDYADGWVNGEVDVVDSVEGLGPIDIPDHCGVEYTAED